MIDFNSGLAHPSRRFDALVGTRAPDADRFPEE